MIKLLVFCLLATLVTMEGNEETPLKSPEDSHSGTETHTNKTGLADNHTSGVADKHTNGGADNHTTNHTGFELSSNTVSSLSCKCSGCQDNQCTAKDSKGFCVTTAESNTLEGIKNSGVDLSCGDNRDVCNKTITITLRENVYWRSNTTCCYHDKCNSPSLAAPPAITTYGKLKCLSCFAVNKTSCTPAPDHMKCLESENKCISVAGKIKKGHVTSTFVGQGCASSSALGLKGTNLTFGDAVYHFTELTFTDTPTHSASITCNCTDCLNHSCTNNVCVTTAEANTLANGKQSSGVRRACRNNSDGCNTSISINLEKNVYWRSHTKCCYSDRCNSPSLDPPPAITTYGKLKCPFCFAINKTSCTPASDHMKCLESENKCIKVSGKIKKGHETCTFTGRGCASSSATLIKGKNLTFEDAVYHFTELTLTDDASQTPKSLPFIFLLSSFVGLLQAKFIY